jgi:hypothetical protein
MYYGVRDLNFSYGTLFMIVVKVVTKCHAYGRHALTIGSLINPFELVLSTRRDGRQSPNPGHSHTSDDFGTRRPREPRFIYNITRVQMHNCTHALISRAAVAVSYGCYFKLAWNSLILRSP